MRGFMRSVWLLNPTRPSAGAGAAAQLPTQCLSLGKTALQSSASWSNPAAAVASTAMDFPRRQSCLDQCPLCPGSDQIPHRSEMTQCAKLGSHYDATSRFKLVERPVLLV